MENLKGLGIYRKDGPGLAVAAAAFLAVLGGPLFGGALRGQEPARRGGWPVAVSQSQEIVEWSSEVWREIRTDAEANYALSSDAGKGTLFRALLESVAGDAPAYMHSIDGSGVRDGERTLDVADMMDEYGIPYEIIGGRAVPDASGLPDGEISLYYVKENVTYDLRSGTFRTYVKELCPVLVRTEEYGEAVRHPLFWVVYEDVRPALERLPVHPVTGNQARVMSASEYLDRRLYSGMVYRTWSTRAADLSAVSDADSVRAKTAAAEERRLENARKYTYDTYGTVRGTGRDTVTVRLPELRRPRRVFGKNR